MNTIPQPEIIAYAAKTILSNLVDLQEIDKRVCKTGAGCGKIFMICGFPPPHPVKRWIFSCHFYLQKNRKIWEKIIRSLTKDFWKCSWSGCPNEFVQSFFLEKQWRNHQTRWPPTVIAFAIKNVTYPERIASHTQRTCKIQLHRRIWILHLSYCGQFFKWKFWEFSPLSFGF